MPEYLAPGVYVEEVDTGSKPIEGVSTSTCGMIGVTERGPVGAPVLVTSVGEFTRWYGGKLVAESYADHRYFPHAIEGFFTNGGKRVYVVRVLDPSATKAASPLFDRGDAASVASTLVRPAGEATGSAATPPDLLILPVAGLGANDWVRVGDGSNAEYRQAVGAPVPQTVMVPVDLPLSRSHALGESAQEFVRAVTTSYTLVNAVAAGSTALVVQGLHADIAALTTGDCVEIGAAGTAEYRFVAEPTDVTVVSGTDSTVRLRLGDAIALDHPQAEAVARVDFTAGPIAPAQTVQLATAGSGLFYVDHRMGNFTNRADLVMLGAGATLEVRRIGDFAQLDIRTPAFDDYPASGLVAAVAPAADRTTSVAPAAADTHLTLQAGETAGLVVGQRIVLDPTGTPEQFSVQALDATTNTVSITPAVAGAGHVAGERVVPRPALSTAQVLAGGRVLALDDRMGLSVGSLLQVGTGAAAEIVTVDAQPALTFVAPDPGNVVVDPALDGGFAAGTSVTLLQPAAPVPGRQVCALALPATAGTDSLYVTDGNAYASGDLVRVTSAGGDVTFHWLTQNATAVVPEMLTLQTALARAHPSGSMVVGRKPLVDVEALDAGIWGNRLRVTVQDESPGLVSSTTLATFVNPTTIRLSSPAGVEAGTVLEFLDPVTRAPLGDPVKVSNVAHTSDRTLSIAGAGLAPIQQVIGTLVRSREFRLTVNLLRQPDPSVPSRNSQVIDQEVFRNLSLDPRHSNFVEKVVGRIGGPLRKWDRRPEGGSIYVRVLDDATTQAVQESVRLGPESLVDTLPDGRSVPAMMRLETTLGDDSVGSLSDLTYLGDDNADPDLRTGLQSLRNVEEVSLVAAPGRVGSALQQGLIDHCEDLRYRFAVLDTLPEPTDTLSDAQGQRQQFDSKYGALYYPWLAIPDPFPTNLADIRDYAIPPAGHVLGVYARTDIERGVHKAPANELVRGVTGLRRKVNKEQQDILNPYPVNINVIRDFRDNNRGIRVYGGRVITADPDFKYVNVRRLLIYIEASLDRGLQWVVFEPNSEPLWARVKRVISNFLIVTWRNGALEGTKPEEAFYVKCDRTTMTQTDIDNGRLIVEVGVAPVKPAEFVIVRIGLWTARSDS